jgi:putative transposase
VQTIRKSLTEREKIYFFTATVHQWKCLLNDNANKDLIISYLKELSQKKLIKLYAFVLMPNHVHLIWQPLAKNGKETPQGSFLKYTAHEFLKKLKQSGQSKEYEVTAANKKHEIWQRDSLSVEIYSREVARQKNIPCRVHPSTILLPSAGLILTDYEGQRVFLKKLAARIIKN